MPVEIYHNPRCSKSRKALELIRERGIEPEIRLYLESPPGRAALVEVVTRLGIHPRDLIRFHEDRAEELGITGQDERSEQEWIDLMVENPVLLERPIVIHRNRALVCRPPEKVLELLD